MIRKRKKWIKKETEISPFFTWRDNVSRHIASNRVKFNTRQQQVYTVKSNRFAPSAHILCLAAKCINSILDVSIVMPRLLNARDNHRNLSSNTSMLVSSEGLDVMSTKSSI